MIRDDEVGFTLARPRNSRDTTMAASIDRGQVNLNGLNSGTMPSQAAFANRGKAAWLGIVPEFNPFKFT